MIDHRDTARRAFAASHLSDPPRSLEAALGYITMLLAMLPAGEQAGYVRGPAGGENVTQLPDGRGLVRISRVMYPDGQIYKVLSDAPNGNPQWEPEDVRPELYVPFTGGHTEPPASDPPTTGELEGRLALLEGQVRDLGLQGVALFDQLREILHQIGLQNELGAAHAKHLQALDTRIDQLPQPPAPWRWPW